MPGILLYIGKSDLKDTEVESPPSGNLWAKALPHSLSTRQSLYPEISHFVSKWFHHLNGWICSLRECLKAEIWGEAQVTQAQTFWGGERTWLSRQQNNAQGLQTRGTFCYFISGCQGLPHSWVCKWAVRRMDWPCTMREGMIFEARMEAGAPIEWP